MADYGIDINVNMGGSQGNFQTLIDSINQLNANFQKVGDSATTAGNRSKQSFADSMNIINKYGGSVQAAAANIDKWKAKIEELNRLNNTGAISQKKYNSEINAAAAAIKRIESATRQYNNVLGQTASTAKSAKSSFAGLTKTLNTLAGVMGTSFSLFGAFMVLKNAIKTIADFELAQKKLRSVLGETSAGMKELSESAIRLGGTSIFGAKGVSELQIELAKMGFAKQDIIDMQKAVVNLATATQEDLASSAEVVANVIRAYNLEAIDAAMVTDVMGKAFNDSALDLANFREAIKYVAPIAKQAGFSFKETTALLETLSNAGIKGSLAGTGLTNIMSRLGNESSKLTKAMGKTVNGYEEFIEAMIKLKSDGADLADVFELVDRRAAAAFTIILQGVDTVDQFNEKLKDVSGTMEKQAAVQLESLSYKFQMMKNSWDGFILSLDSGSSQLSVSLKGVVDGITALLDLLSGSKKETAVEGFQTILDNARKFGVEITDEYIKEIEEKLKSADNKTRQAAWGWIISWGLSSKFKEEANKIYKDIEESSSVYIEETRKKIVEEAKFLNDEAKKLMPELWTPENYGDIIAQMQSDLPEDKTSREYIIQTERIKQLTKEYEVYLKTKNLDLKTTSELNAAEKERLRLLKERYEYELRVIKLKSSIESENIKLATDEYTEDILLAIEAFDLKKKILDKELERDIAFGEDKVRIKNIYNLELQNAELEYQNKIQSITEKMQDELLKSFEEVNKDIENELKEINKTSEQIAKEFVDDIINEYQRLTDLNKFMDKFGQDNPIINLLFGKGLREDLLSGAISEDDVSNFAETFNDLAGIVEDNLEGIVNSWVDATNKIVDQLNRQVYETQSAIAVEAELMAAGYANNLTAERDKLEKLKEMRREALEDQKQAQRTQLAMDSAQQVSGLITSAVKVFQAESGKGILGIALAIAGIATMFGMMAKYRALAKQQSIEQFAEGGWIGGKSHRDGGTHIEAEKGEYVINKRSAFKHKELIEAINGDNKYELNKIYLNNLKNQVLTASVSLDDSKELKAIRKLLEEKGKTVEYINGYRIERVGNVTTKIRLN